MVKISSLKEKVQNQLTNNPQTRDSNRLLVLNIWMEQMAEVKISFENFCDLYLDKKLSDHDVITRASRKLQEEIPELRGEGWLERHAKEPEVKEDIKTGFFKNKEEKDVARKKIREIIKTNHKKFEQLDMFGG